jgi:hypothetical protein
VGPGRFGRGSPSSAKDFANALVGEVEFFCFFGGFAEKSGAGVVAIRMKKFEELVIRAPCFLEGGAGLQTEGAVAVIEIHLLIVDQANEFLAKNGEEANAKRLIGGAAVFRIFSECKKHPIYLCC